MTMWLSRRAFLGTSALAISGLYLAACGVPTPTPSGSTPNGSTPVPDGSRAGTPGTAPSPISGQRIDETVDGYVAVAPSILRIGQAESVSLSLFRGSRPANSTVTVALLGKDGRPVADGSGWVAGRGSVALQVPSVPAGDYQLRVSGKGFQEQAPIRIEDGTLAFIETDKPIYKPGQTIHIRMLALDPMLKPSVGEAVVEAMDAKGIKVFKKTVPIDEFGTATLELPLSTEPNLGVWKILGTIGDRRSQIDVRVERYVLPKYEVKVDLAKSWALASEAIKGTIAAEYSFGKPVRGEAEIVASRYVGTWQEYARVTQPIDGRLTFEIPAVRYAAGSPAGGGLSNVQLEVTVREQSTGYEEQTSQLVTIAQTPVSVRVVPESNTFKPSLPFSLLVVAETPDKKPVDTNVRLEITYQDDRFANVKQETQQVATRNGVALVKLTPPTNAAMLSIEGSARDASGARTILRAGYSPSGTFIHVEQVSTGALKVGDTARFKIAATRQGTNFYYEVIARGKVVFSDFSSSPDLAIALTPLMAPEARLLVYQVLPNGEVAADYLPFSVEGSYPQNVTISFDKTEAKPGEELNVEVQAGSGARVGLVAVDRSVFILAENRLNLQQVFAELERLFMQPQVELHDAVPLPPFDAGPVPEGRGAPVAPIVADAAVGIWGGPSVPSHLRGAKETFREAGVIVLSNRQVPEGKELLSARMLREGPVMAAADSAAAPPPQATPALEKVEQDGAAAGEPLAEVQRVRQFFPETWLWTDLTTDGSGRATHRVTAPDSITTWMFRAVALSKDQGLGIGEAQFRVFQPFFVQVDLPYSAIRGEEFPARIALYNYQSTAQDFFVELENADWFDLLDTANKSVTVPANSVGGAEFRIRPKTLGVQGLKVTARSRNAADAIVKELIVEPEGVQRELVENLVLSPGAPRLLDLTVPPAAVAGSARAVIALTGNVLSQTIEGLEGLLKMPFGCGEQNMILFAPNVFITRYLKETGQIKPEVMAKAEKLMLTGYQRELTFRRSDASFSAFGEQDQEGSLWLTAFVLKTFAQSRDLIFVDDAVLDGAKTWILQHQNADGSFDPVGFVHHEEMLGGLKGKTALSAFVAVALHEAAGDGAAAQTIGYLEGKLDETNDAYSLALSTYALALAKSGRAGEAKDRLLKLAKQSDEGIYWEDDLLQPRPADGDVVDSEPRPRILPMPKPTAAIETTGYAALALLQLGDRISASAAVRWLASQRNAYGGFGSTQDTVVALQAMSSAAAISRSEVDATVSLRGRGWTKDVSIVPENADVLQLVEVPADQLGQIDLEVQGKGQVMAQVVRRFNLAAPEPTLQPPFVIDVRYSADQVEVNDLITVTASVRFTPPRPVEATMVVLDISVPTGFDAVTDTVEAALQREPRLKRYDVSGRKVIFYVEGMLPNDEIEISFQARALYPVRAQPVTSQVYSYYQPDLKAESLGKAVLVGSR